MTLEVDALELRLGPEGELRLRVRVRPGAAREEVTGVEDGALALRLRARPVEGAANDSLPRFLGRVLDIAPSRIRLVGGARSRHKTVAVDGLDAATLRRRLRESAGR